MTVKQSDQAMEQKRGETEVEEKAAVAVGQEQEQEEKSSRKAQRKKQQKEKSLWRTLPRRRIFPIWLRIVVVLIFSAAALVAGLMVGYGVVGDGNPIDALRIETWQHIIDIVTK